jgi:hypothetical protein
MLMRILWAICVFSGAIGFVRYRWGFGAVSASILKVQLRVCLVILLNCPSHQPSPLEVKMKTTLSDEMKQAIIDAVRESDLITSLQAASTSACNRQ